MTTNTMQTKEPTQHVKKTFLYSRCFLRYIELNIAPIVPNTIRKIAAIEISKSVGPKGLMSRLALEAKVWKLP